jgi:hypothetical protein
MERVDMIRKPLEVGGVRCVAILGCILDVDILWISC